MPVIHDAGRPEPRRPGPQDRRPGRPHPRQQDRPGRALGRHVHAHQHRQPRRAVRHPDHQPAAGRRSWAPARSSSGRSWSGPRTAASRSPSARWSTSALTYDHRIVDGADAARFLGTVKARLEAARSRPSSACSRHRPEGPAIGGALRAVRGTGPSRRCRHRGCPGRAGAGTRRRSRMRVVISGSSGLIGTALVPRPAQRRATRWSGSSAAPRRPPTSAAGTRRRDASTTARSRRRRGDQPRRRRASATSAGPTPASRSCSTAGSTPPTCAPRAVAARGSRCWSSASAVGYYGDTGDVAGRRDRRAAAAASSPSWCRDWENADRARGARPACGWSTSAPGSSCPPRAG